MSVEKTSLWLAEIRHGGQRLEKVNKLVSCRVNTGPVRGEILVTAFVFKVSDQYLRKGGRLLDCGMRQSAALF